MTIDELHRYIHKVPITTSNYDTHTSYRNFFRIYVDPIHSTRSFYQKCLEELRPILDYTVLPDSSILIGAAEDFHDMKYAALELMTERLAKIQRTSLKYHEDLLQTVRFYKSGELFNSVYPELCI